MINKQFCPAFASREPVVDPFEIPNAIITLTYVNFCSIYVQKSRLFAFKTLEGIKSFPSTDTEISPAS